MSLPTNEDHGWQNRAEMALASATSLGRIVTYAEMADAADIPAPQRIHKLTLWLEATMRQDHAAGHVCCASGISPYWHGVRLFLGVALCDAAPRHIAQSKRTSRTRVFSALSGTWDLSGRRNRR